MASHDHRLSDIAVLVASAILVASAVLAPAQSRIPSRRMAEPPLSLSAFSWTGWLPLVAEEKPDPSGQRGSGGRAVVHAAGGKLLGSTSLRGRAPDARLYRTGSFTFEPTLGVTKSGAIFMDARSAQGGRPQVLRSQDNGATWEVVFEEHPFTMDPYLYVDPETSRIFSNDLAVPCHLISFSDDDGKTWTTAPPAGCLHNEDHQTLFAGSPPEGGSTPDNYPNIVYLCSVGLGISVASAGSVCSKSLDGGVTFVPTGEPAYTDDPRHRGDFGIPGRCNGANAHGFVGPDGTIYLPRGWCGQPWLAMSKNEGLTWTRVQVAENGMPCCGIVEGDTRGELHSHEAGVVADRDGNVYYTWVAADRLPYLSISRDGGKTWGDPMMIGPPGVRETLLPGIAIGKAGKIVVHYMGSTNSAWNGKEITGSYEDTTWNAYMTMSVNALGKNPVFYSASINDLREPLWIGECGPDPFRCAWGDFFDVVIGTDGTPWSVGVDLCRPECGTGRGEGFAGRLVGGPRLD